MNGEDTRRTGLTVTGRRKRSLHSCAATCAATDRAGTHQRFIAPEDGPSWQPLESPGLTIEVGLDVYA